MPKSTSHKTDNKSATAASRVADELKSRSKVVKVEPSAEKQGVSGVTNIYI